MNLKTLVIFAFALALSLHSCQAADSYSWDDVNGISYINQVKNQNFPNYCNSGWAMSTIDMLSARIKILRKAQSPDITLSSQVLLSCDTKDFGCLGGEPLSALRWIKENNITDESCHSYKAKGYTNGESCSSKAKCQKCSAGTCTSMENSKIYALSDFGPLAGENDMMQEIGKWGPIVCGTNTEAILNYTSGIIDSALPGQTVRINHYVVVYGWGVEDGQKYWKVKNSWGPSWGEKGHFRIAKGKNTLGIEGRCIYSSLTDTWTKDIRNNTLPSSQWKEDNFSVPDNLPPYLTPSRSSLTPSSCNTAWAFSVIQMIADRVSKDSNRKTTMMLSVQALLNCGAGKCSSGNPADALLFIQKYGLPEEGCQTYQGKEPAKESCTAINNCAFCNGTIFESRCFEWKNYKRWKIFDFGSFSGVENMKNQLAMGPIVCGIYSSKSFQNYRGGIFSEITIAPKIDHYVEIVGWSAEGGKNHWIGRNSWGTAWGESSFFRIQMGSNNLGIENKCYFAKGLS